MARNVLRFFGIARAQTTLASSTLGAPAGTTQSNIQMGSTATAVAGQVVVANTEIMGIVSVNGRQLNVTRGSNGSTAAAHVLGTTLWIGPLNAFVASDPSGACTRVSLPYVPVVSTSTGNAYDCIGSVYTLVAGAVSVLGTVNGGTGNNTYAANACLITSGAGTSFGVLTGFTCSGGTISVGTGGSIGQSGSGIVQANRISTPGGPIIPVNLNADTCVAITADGLSMSTLDGFICDPGSKTITVSTGATIIPASGGIIYMNRFASVSDGVIKSTSGVPSPVSGTGTNCVLVNGTSKPC